MMILIENQKRDTIVTLRGNLSIAYTNKKYEVYHNDTPLGTYEDKNKAYWIFEFLTTLPDAAVHRLEKGKKVIGVAPSNLEFIQMPE